VSRDSLPSSDVLRDLCLADQAKTDAESERRASVKRARTVRSRPLPVSAHG
jgi:hypothetical protein